ncbi:dTDP-4-amino-4,6-dideoxy-D-glucose acyltransferase [compost metagenome]
MAYLSRSEISEMGFASVGEGALLSDKASYYNCAGMVIGNNVRVDDFCILSAGVGGVEIGSYVHIAAFSLLIGAGKITLHDFSGLSSRVSVYSSTDDYSGAVMTNPTVSSEFTGVVSADVCIGRHVIIGSGSVVLPGVVLEEGVAVGALSLVSKSCSAFSVYSGVPARRIKERKRNLLELEKEFIASSALLSGANLHP